MINREFEKSSNEIKIIDCCTADHKYLMFTMIMLMETYHKGNLLLGKINCLCLVHIFWRPINLSALKHYNYIFVLDLLMLCLTFIFGDTIGPLSIETLE